VGGGAERGSVGGNEEVATRKDDGRVSIAQSEGRSFIVGGTSDMDVTLPPGRILAAAAADTRYLPPPPLAATPLPPP